MTKNAKILAEQISPKIVFTFQILEPPSAAANGQRYNESHRHRNVHRQRQAATRVLPESNKNRHFSAAGASEEENIKISIFSSGTSVDW